MVSLIVQCSLGYGLILLIPYMFILHIDADQYPKKIEFHRPLRNRPPDLRRIDDSVYDPYWWEHGKNGQQNTVRRGDGPYSQSHYSSNVNRPNNGRRRHPNPHPNHNYNPHQQVHYPKQSRPSHPYRTHQYFSSNYNPYKNIYTSPVSQTRRKDHQRFSNGGHYSRPQVKRRNF